MKRYLYEVTKCDIPIGVIPWMPKTLAEKTAKYLNRYDRTWHGTYGTKKVIYDVVQNDGSWKRKGITTKDGTPHDYKGWFDYYGRSKA